MSAPRVSGVQPHRHSVGVRLDARRRGRVKRAAVYAGAVALTALAYYLAGRIGLELYTQKHVGGLESGD